MCGILGVLHAALDMEHLILDNAHYLLYLLVPAMQPRMLMMFNAENMESVQVSALFRIFFSIENIASYLSLFQVDVRVGQALDTVGQAGRPKTITGFQTHTTPVLLSSGERAELATDECMYFPLTSSSRSSYFGDYLTLFCSTQIPFLTIDLASLFVVLGSLIYNFAGIPLTTALEGFVVVKKNPDYKPVFAN